MKILKAIIHLIMLVTTPALLAYPQPPPVYYAYSQTHEWICPTTYDEIMQMLDALESGELERKYSPMQLERVNEYLALLAQEGIFPDEFDEERALEEDIEELMYGEDSAFQLVHYLEESNAYAIIPAVFNGYSEYDIIQCGIISKAWKKTKKFVKKHKKVIIIGAVVVVATTVVVVAAVAVSAAGAATVAAGAAAAGSSSSDSKEEPLAVFAAPNETLTSADVNEAPIIKATIDKHVASFKEFLVEDKAEQLATSYREMDELSFGEKVREAGANIAHQAYDEISDLVKVVPQLCEEVKELGSKFLPDSLTPPNNGDTGNPIENYENLVAKGHDVIDKVFSTDQAEFFTAEAKANDPMNNFAIGMLPLPSGIPKVFSNKTKLIENGKVLDRAGYTKAGRNLMKHGYREGSIFSKPVGNPKQINENGQKVLESILNHPERRIAYKQTKNLGEVVDIHAPGIEGIRYNASGELIGFLEP